jgi:hypothetical protein
VSSLLFLGVWGIHVAADFTISKAQGWGAIADLCDVAAGGAALIGLIMLGVWLPAAIRTVALKRTLLEATFYVVELIPGFWGRLNIRHDRHSPGSALQDTVLSVEADSVTL